MERPLITDSDLNLKSYKEIQKLATDLGINAICMKKDVLISLIQGYKVDTGNAEVIKDTCKVQIKKRTFPFLVGGVEYKDMKPGNLYTVPIDVARHLREAGYAV